LTYKHYLNPNKKPKQEKMSRYRILDQQGLNYLTCTIVGWVDVLTRAEYRDIVLESLAYCRQAKGLWMFDYVLISDHLHMIAKAKEGHQLSARLRDFKNQIPNPN
jgi:putative transposase